mgnify:CR=1 FL=1
MENAKRIKNRIRKWEFATLNIVRRGENVEEFIFTRAWCFWFLYKKKKKENFSVFFRWWTGPWQLCPATCGEYPKILRKRTVLCIEQIDQEPLVYTQPPNLRHHGGIEYLESETRNKKSLKQYLEEEEEEQQQFKKDDKTFMKEFLEEEIMALPDVQCKGQEKPYEQEPCPNLPPCGSPEKNNLKSDGSPASSVRFENGFTESEINCTELSSDNASRNATNCEWLKTLEKKGKKIRHELRKSNETLKIIYGNVNNNNNNNRDVSRKTFNNRRNKKIKKKKKDKTKKNFRGTGDVEELSSSSSSSSISNFKIRNNKSNSNDYDESIDNKSTAKTIPITNYLYYKSQRKNRRQTFIQP